MAGRLLGMDLNATRYFPLPPCLKYAILRDLSGCWSQVVNKWFLLQASSDIPGNVENVKKLLDHPAFDLRNPNKASEFSKLSFSFTTFFLSSMLTIIQVYSLIGGFCGSPVNFHAKDGSGYKFLGDIVVQLDKINPQVWLPKLNLCVIFCWQ